jgi:hypothetical protein
MFEVNILILKTTANASFQTQFIRFAVLPKIKRIDKTHMCRLKRQKKKRWTSIIYREYMSDTWPLKKNSIINWAQIKKY